MTLLKQNPKALVAGNSRVLAFDLDLTIEGAPDNITNLTEIEFALASDHESDPLIEKTETNNGGITISKAVPDGDGPAQIEVAIDPADTAALSAGFYVYDVKVIDADGTVSTVASGRWEILPAIA